VPKRKTVTSGRFGGSKGRHTKGKGHATRKPSPAELALEQVVQSCVAGRDVSEAAYMQGRPPRVQFELKVDLLGRGPNGGGLRPGDLLSCRVQADRAFYIGIWEVTPDRVIQVFPNHDVADKPLRKGQARLVPGARSRARARVTGDAEFLHVLASTQPLPAPGTPAGRSGPFDVFDLGDWRAGLLRGLHDVRMMGDGALVSEVIVPLRGGPDRRRPLPARAHRPAGR
jgi:hypothetical protein